MFYDNLQSEQITVSNGKISTEAPSSTEIPFNNDTFFNTCGTFKSCFGYPNNCVDRKSCNFATTIVRSSDGSYIFELISFQCKSIFRFYKCNYLYILVTPNKYFQHDQATSL